MKEKDLRSSKDPLECFWRHLLATASGIESCEYDSFWDVNSNPVQRYVPRDTIWGRCSPGGILLLSTGIRCHFGRIQRHWWRFSSFREHWTFSPITSWGSHTGWHPCHCWYKPTWKGSHGKLVCKFNAFVTVFLRRKRLTEYCSDVEHMLKERKHQTSKDQKICFCILFLGAHVTPTHLRMGLTHSSPL